MHIHLVLAVIISIAYAIRKNSLFPVAAVIANIPWFILNWTAVNNNTGYLYAYYSFPLITIFVWPIIWYVLEHGNKLNTLQIKQALLAQCLLCAAGLVAYDESKHEIKFGPAFYERWGSYNLQNSTINKEHTINFLNKLDDNLFKLGAVMADSGVNSVATGKNTERNLLLPSHNKEVDILLFIKTTNLIPSKMATIAQSNNLYDFYCAKETTICLLTKLSGDKLVDLMPLLTKQSLPNNIQKR
jgi:hypothetical protein